MIWVARVEVGSKKKGTAGKISGVGEHFHYFKRTAGYPGTADRRERAGRGGEEGGWG